ncbi:hypothetical protein ACQI4E_10595 [Streptomyces sp. CA-252508]|uniref:hypothetical protein n=1 Tax=Streptomyces sp. CA-252508 TaxID=3418946 RepID=UPI003D8D0923
MRTAPAPGPRDAKSESAPEDEKNPQYPKNTHHPDSADPDGDTRPDSPSDTAGPSGAAGPAGPRKRTPALIFDDPLDQQSADDTDRGWGERPPAGGSAADLARFLDEKPPHHL